MRTPGHGLDDLLSNIFCVLSTSRDKKQSRRSAFRFHCEKRKVRYRTAYEEGEADLTNISTDGCAVDSASLPLSEQDEALIIIDIEGEEQNLEAKGVVVRAEGAVFAVRFTRIEASTKRFIRIFFAKESRKQV